jgi:hypothetical protein
MNNTAKRILVAAGLIIVYWGALHNYQDETNSVLQLFGAWYLGLLMFKISKWLAPDVEEQQELAQQEREQAIKAAQLKEQEEKPAFAVGKTQDGRVTLSIGGYHNIWINMTNEGVDQLVAMLLAAKNTEEEE